MKEALIHPTAIIDPHAQLHSSVRVGAYAVIGAKVKIGANTSIGPHAVIEGRTKIGQDNKIFQFASIGAISQDKKYAGEDTELVIGDRNVIREFCTLHLGTAQGGGVTRVGHDNWIMAYVHIAHDCWVGDHVTMSNNATLAGHVHLGDWVTVGGLTGIHQFVKIGMHAMLGFGSAITQDVMPFVTADGNPSSVRGLNAEGLKRRGFGAQRLNVLKQIYKITFRQDLSLLQAQQNIQELLLDLQLQKEKIENEVQTVNAINHSIGDVKQWLEFMSQSMRGLVR